MCTEFVGKPDGKRPLESPRRRWAVNNKMDLEEVGCEVWTGSSWLWIGTGGGGTCEWGNEQSGSTKCGEFRN